MCAEYGPLFRMDGTFLYDIYGNEDTVRMAEESTSSIDWGAIGDAIVQYHVQEIFLGIVGVVALLIAFSYLKDKESANYKLFVLLGVIVGALMVAICVLSPVKTAKGTTIIIAIGCFALIIRPFRDVHFAVIIALMVMAVVYILLGGITDEPFNVLATGWPRIIASFVAGAIAYMLLNFAQAIVLLCAKVLNAWPVLIVLAIICITEAICVYMGYDSVYDTIVNFAKDKTASNLIWL